MSKRQSRPWDTYRPEPKRTGTPADFTDHFARAEAILAGPSVNLDGVKFYSDRFYLNHVEGDPDVAFTAGPKSNVCTCGFKSPPPLWNRERFVNSLQLKAAIFGTFSLDLVWMSETFPSLVGPNATVPLLLLHGQKGLDKTKSTTEQVADDSSVVVGSEDQTAKQVEVVFDQGRGVEPMVPKSTAPSELLNFRLPWSSPTKGDGASVDGNDSFKTQEDVRSPSVVARTEQSQEHAKRGNGKEANKGPVSVKDTDKPLLQSFGKDCHLSKVLSAWSPAKESKATHEAFPEANKSNQKSRETKRGVHHPKFMVLFETNGDVVVIVSTANLTKTRTVEGSWVQRFKPKRRPAPNMVRDANGFGEVLQDFLGKLSESTVPGQLKVHDFLMEYMSFGLSDFASHYHFEKAQVHLVPVIPGDWRGRTKKSQGFLYGRQRVQYVLSQYQRDLLVSKKDRLIFQPTSIGGNWTRSEMTDVVRTYLNRDKSHSDYWDDEALLGKADIVWPSRECMKLLNSKGKGKDALGEPSSSVHEDERVSSFVFMTSQSFNSCDVACISRMARYELSSPPQHPSPLVPHFKSVGRLLTNHSVATNKGFAQADEYLSWFLLTSACLSHGAQGKRSSLENESARVKYANFELGVLFTSVVQARNKRLYCFHPRHCNCGELGSTHQLIHLPIPYSLRPRPYLEDEEDMVMQENPFFHEIESGTRCVGNMLLTPYGVNQSRYQNKNKT